MSARRSLFALLVRAAALFFVIAATAHAMQPAVPVQGQLFSRTQGPVPGLAAVLVHPVLGRSAPSFTDIHGRFGWGAIPVRPEAYFLEIYWGRNLIYRQPIQVGGPLLLPAIQL